MNLFRTLMGLRRKDDSVLDFFNTNSVIKVQAEITQL